MFTRLFKGVVFITACAALCSQSLSAFTIINQTNEDRIMTLQEAYRPESEIPGDLERPISLNPTPLRLVVPAKSSIMTEIAPCTVLLVNVKETVRKGRKNTVTTSTTCYQPYSLDKVPVDEITDEWGLVIHDPIPTAWPMPWEKTYGIKLVHPDLMEKIDSLDVLPAVLRNKGPSPLQSSSRR